MKKLLLLLLVFATNIAISQIPQPLPNTYVNDFAHVLTDEQITSLNQNIAQIEKASTVQFAIVLIDKLPDNYTIEDYSLLLARKWHVGTDKNGLVYVAAIQDHKQRLEKALGLDSVFTQQKNLDILNSIKPSFKGKDYYGGLQVLINQVSTTLNVGPDPTQQPQQQAQAPAQQGNLAVDQNNAGDGSSIFLIVGAIFIIIVVLLIIAGNRRRRINGPINYNGNIDPNYVNGPSSGGGGFFMGAILGALGLFATQNIQDDLSNQQGNDNGDPGNQDNNNDNDSSSWGNWGGGDSSSDSGFSSSDSDSGSSSDW
jgi:uncharacterized protein